MDTVFGLRVHPLVVHGTVVAVPAAALAVVVAAVAGPAWAARVAAVRWVPPVLVGLSVLTGAGTLVQVVLVGHSGAKATWSTGTPVHAAGRPGIVDR